MKKLVLACSLLSLPIAAMATNPFLPKHLLQQPKQATASAMKTVNFSGDWSGHCESQDGQQDKFDLTIEQNDLMINMSMPEYEVHTKYLIGEVKIKNVAQSSHTESTVLHASWNDDRNVLSMHEVYYAAGKSNTYQFNMFFSEITKLELSMAGDKLVVKGDSYSINADRNAENFNCQFDKVYSPE